MKFNDALKQIEKHRSDSIKGFMVSFEVQENGALLGDHFPDTHIGEPLIQTESEAWNIATEFSKVSPNNVNILVTDHAFKPVKGYKERMLNKYQALNTE